ncbi:hypothetical protein [Actinopolymorpha alba]|uniref:hypothetical protein n=1 Tax=Actinopolymorpha alba TaxID=533267 RepID=UPI0003631258|nr:hypothetical protein [Actinopolymorpha alba]
MGNTVVRVALIGGVVALGVAALDRALLWMERRRWIYYRRTKGASKTSREIFQTFDPGAQALKKAMEQEKIRKVVRPSGDPPFDVDLDSGIVRVRKPEDAEGNPDGQGTSR